MAQKIFLVKKLLGQKKIAKKDFIKKKTMVQKKIWVRFFFKFGTKKIFRSMKFFVSKKMLGQKILRPTGLTRRGVGLLLMGGGRVYQFLCQI